MHVAVKAAAVGFLFHLEADTCVPIIISSSIRLRIGIARAGVVVAQFMWPGYKSVLVTLDTVPYGTFIYAFLSHPLYVRVVQLYVSTYSGAIEHRRRSLSTQLYTSTASPVKGVMLRTSTRGARVSVCESKPGKVS